MQEYSQACVIDKQNDFVLFLKDFVSIWQDFNKMQWSEIGWAV